MRVGVCGGVCEDDDDCDLSCNTFAVDQRVVVVRSTLEGTVAYLALLVSGQKRT